MKKPTVAEDPFIDISNRPLEEHRPIGPFIGCGGGSEDDRRRGVPQSVKFKVDYDDSGMYHGDTHEERVHEIVLGNISEKFSSSDVSVQEMERPKGAGDVEVTIDVTGKTIRDVKWLEAKLDDIENDDRVLHIYDVKMPSM